MDAINPATDTANKSEQTNWRDVLPVHPAADLFPLMSEAELRELADDIEKQDLRDPVDLYYDRDTNKVILLDGRNRLDALELLGELECEVGNRQRRHPTPPIASSFGTPVCCRWVHDTAEQPLDAYAYVISKNIHRRHLTADQRRELIAKVLKAKPEASNRTIAKQVKADDKTVAKVRTELEATAEIPQLEKTTGKDGKARPARRHTPEPVPPEPTTPGIVPEPVPLKGWASKPMTPDQFMDRALPTFRDVYCSALTEMAKGDPAGARDCAAKMHAAIDEAIEVARDDQARVTISGHAKLMLEDGLPPEFIRSAR